MRMRPVMDKEIIFESDGLRLAGILRTPDLHMRYPAVLLLHGTMEQDRDGNLLQNRNGEVPFRKNFFLLLAERLCEEGFAAFSWDRRGFGKSDRGIEDVFSLARDAKAALDVLCALPEVDPKRIAIFGQSAGVYTSCLLAQMDPRGVAFVLSGGLFRDYGEMMAFNYARVVEYVKRSEKNRAFVEENDLFGLVIGLNLDQIRRDALEGKREHELNYRGSVWRFAHDPTCYFPDYAPSRQFRHIRKPVLIIHGDSDLNVPVEDAFKIRDALVKNGNDHVELCIIEGADHSFNIPPEDEDLRIMERMSLESFRRPYNEKYFKAIVVFLNKYLNIVVGKETDTM